MRTAEGAAPERPAGEGVRAPGGVRDALRSLDPGRLRLKAAVRTLLAAVGALVASAAVWRAAGLPGGVIVIAAVVAVTVSRTLHGTSLAHRLSALLYVPAVGVLAGLVGRFMLHHMWWGAALYVGAVAGSRYVMRFGGKVRALGRLALSPLLAVMVVPIPPSAAKAVGPVWGAVAAAIAVACVLLAEAAVPPRPAREAATAAYDVVRAAERLRARPTSSRARARTAASLHAAALATEDRLSAMSLRLPPGAEPPTAPAALSAAVLHAEVLAYAAGEPHAEARPTPDQNAGPGSTHAQPLAAAGTATSHAGAVVPHVGAGGEAGPEPYGSTYAQPLAAGTATSQAGAGAPGPLVAGAAGHGPHAPRPATGQPPGDHPAVGLDPDLGLDLDLGEALLQVARAADDVRRLDARESPTHEPPRRAARKGVQPQTRLTAQLAAAMAAGFAAGHLAFPHHWTWTVITAFVVCSGARSRGDVVHRSGLRVCGAFAGAVTGTLVAHLVAGQPLAATAVILGYLFLGTWLRDVTYAIWAFCVTSLLAVLYSLNGEHGTGALLLQRPEGILLGSACGIAAAYFVLPLRTETVMRGRAARTLQVLQDLLAAVREPEPHPAALRALVRDADRACRDLGAAAASVRAHRALVRRRHRPAPHAADWADTLALCVRQARVLATTPAPGLAAARPHLALTARNLGHVRRRLGRRPDAEPPRPLPATSRLHPLNATLATLFHQLPA